jgi:hypothetical protein
MRDGRGCGMAGAAVAVRDTRCGEVNAADGPFLLA